MLTTAFVTILLFGVVSVAPFLTDMLSGLAIEIERAVSDGLTCMSSAFNGGAGC